MSKHGKYIPSNKVQFAAWLLNFVKMCLKYVNHYGINQEEIKMLETQSGVYQGDMTSERELLNKKRAQFKKTAKDRKEVEKTVRSLAQGIKVSLDYTEEIGREFDIIGAEDPFDPDTFKPVLELKKKDHGVEISFNKSQTDGVNIYRKMQGETDFTFLSRDTNSPYIDNKDIVSPIKIEYYAMAVIDDEEIGLESDTAKITI